MLPRYTPPLSQKVWAAMAVSGGDQSPSLEIQNCPFVSAFGHASAATTITVMLSDSGVAGEWYAGPSVTLASSGDFYINGTFGARFLALQSSGAATVTGIISAR